jgi:hypothetical protein
MVGCCAMVHNSQKHQQKNIELAMTAATKTSYKQLLYGICQNKEDFRDVIKAQKKV